MTNAAKKRNKENKLNVLVTGASNGIGKEVADIFLANNHFVIGLDIVEGENKENLVSFKVDICDKNLLNNVKQYLINNNIKLDLIINIAGIHSMASLVETNFDVIKRLIDIENPSKETIDALAHLDLPSGVDIQIKKWLKILDNNINS